MKALIPAKAYWDEAVFKWEMDEIFSRTWHFVCTRSAVGNDDDFVVVEVAGKSLFVQNFKGELRCFLNICSHRFCNIRSESAGNGPVRCPYHGWAYDSSGIPAGIPHRPRFENLTPDCIQSLALKRYRLELCGELVFVCLDHYASTLRESFGVFFDEVSELSRQMGQLIDTVEWTIECNWKVFVENSLESYHVSFVHPNTFGKIDLKVDSIESRSDAFANIFLAGLRSQTVSMRKVDKALSSRPLKPTGYQHISLFPAYLMATMTGITFSIQRIVPQSATSIKMTSMIYHYLPGPGDAVTQPMLDLLHQSAAAFSREAISEDIPVCEAVQRGLRHVGQAKGMLSDEEIRIVDFQKHYLGFLNRRDQTDSLVSVALS